MDKDEYRVCPYDPQHKVRSSRFEIHLSKCAKHHSTKIFVCPFNSKHVLTSKDKLNNHFVECPDNKRVDYELKLNHIMDEMYVKETTPVDSSQPVNSFVQNEDWDSEIRPPNAPVPPTIGICYANMTRKQRKDLNQRQLEEFNKKYNPK